MLRRDPARPPGSDPRRAGPRRDDQPCRRSPCPPRAHCRTPSSPCRHARHHLLRRPAPRRDRQPLVPRPDRRAARGRAAGSVGPRDGWGDANGDGWPDLFLATYAAYPPLTANPDWTDPGHDHAPDRLLLGGPAGFRLDPAFPALRGWTSGVAFTDLDRDGDDDLVVARYAELRQPREPAGSTTLLRNDRGRFTVVPGLPPGPGGRLGGRSVAVLDHDGDGLLDLLLLQDRYGGGSSRLLRNPGRLGRPWTDITASAGLPLDLEGFSAATADLDGDGPGGPVRRRFGPRPAAPRRAVRRERARRAARSGCGERQRRHRARLLHRPPTSTETAGPTSCSPPTGSRSRRTTTGSRPCGCCSTTGTTPTARPSSPT